MQNGNGAADTGTTDTAPRETGIENTGNTATGMETGNGTGEIVEGTGTGIVMGIEVVVGGTTTTMMAVGRGMMTIGGMTGVDETTTRLSLERMVPLATRGEREEARMVPLNEGLLHRRRVSRCRRGGGRLQDGMYMHQDMSNIQHCRRNKLARLPIEMFHHMIFTCYFFSRPFQPSRRQPHANPSHSGDPGTSNPNARSYVWHGIRCQPKFVAPIAPPLYRQYYSRS